MMFPFKVALYWFLSCLLLGLAYSCGSEIEEELN
jgi:hypothetical protein